MYPPPPSVHAVRARATGGWQEHMLGRVNESLGRNDDNRGGYYVCRIRSDDDKVEASVGRSGQQLLRRYSMLKLSSLTNSRGGGGGCKKTFRS